MALIIERPLILVVLVILCASGAFADIYENDDSYENASWITTQQIHTISPAGDIDWVKFNVTAGAKYIIQTNDLRNGTDTILALYDTDGTTKITENDDIVNGIIRRSKISWTATSTGAFYAKVNDWDASLNNGHYNLSVLELPNVNINVLNYSSRAEKNSFFNFTVNVSCNGINCNNINVYLDPRRQGKQRYRENVLDMLANLTSLEEGEYDVVIMLKEPPKKAKKSEMRQRKTDISEEQKNVLSSLGIPIRRQFEGASSSKFKLARKFNVINAVSGKVTKQGMELLKNSPYVESVQLKYDVGITLQDSVPLINATNAWLTQLNGINITGTGQTVCIIDTGINYAHSDFGSLAGFPNAKVIGGYDFVNDDNDPLDDHGHGSHVAGIAASQDLTYKGVAPDARIVAIKALAANGVGSSEDIIAGIDWCVYHAEELNISVISMSLGDDSLYSTYCDSDQVAQAVNYANSLGIIVAIAAGNNGYTNGISRPACASGALAVSSIRKDDSTIDYNRAALTDVLAPGYSITSTDYDGAHVGMSGTSMAAPHAAGAAALLNQYYFLHDGIKLHSLQIAAMLKETGALRYDSGSNLNFSRINLLAALAQPIPKGIISTNASATPFYTISNNPYTVSINAGDFALLAWQINATGNYGAYTFYAFTDFDGQDEVLSNKVNISIVEITKPSVYSAFVNNTLVKLSTPLRITVNASDSNLDTVKVNNLLMSLSAGNMYEINTTPSLLGCGDGICTLRFNASDTFGNFNDTTLLNITVDALAPKVFSPAIDDADLVVKSSTTLNIRINVTDNNLNTSSVKVNNLLMSILNGDMYEINTTGSLLGCNGGSCELRFSASDILGNLNDTTILTITADNSAPTISSVSATTTYSSATIAVSSNENVDLTINYGLTSTSLNDVRLTTTYTTSHSLKISGLSSSLTYYYNVKICDVVGYCTTSSIYSFETEDRSSSSTPTTGGAAGGGGGGSGLNKNLPVEETLPQLPIPLFFKEECHSDNDCSENQFCLGVCRPVSCSGIIKNHACYECESDSDCNEGEACIDSKCSDKNAVTAAVAKGALALNMPSNAADGQEVNVKVLDEITMSPIKDAIITIKHPSGKEETIKTNEQGMTSFVVKGTGTLKYTVEASGYPLLNKEVKILASRSSRLWLWSALFIIMMGVVAGIVIKKRLSPEEKVLRRSKFSFER